jgi:hypothetical protein
MQIAPMLALDYAIRRAFADAGIPLTTVSIGSVTVRSTWTVVYGAAATPAQIAQGVQILATLDPQEATTLANIKADLTVGLVDDEVLTALARSLYECIPAPTKTLVQLRARFLQLLRA